MLLFSCQICLETKEELFVKSTPNSKFQALCIAWYSRSVSACTYMLKTFCWTTIRSEKRRNNTQTNDVQYKCEAQSIRHICPLFIELTPIAWTSFTRITQSVPWSSEGLWWRFWFNNKKWYDFVPKSECWSRLWIVLRQNTVSVKLVYS